MTDDNKNDVQPIAEEQASSSETTFRSSVGTPLRLAREAAGLSLDQIADQLHLRPTLIKEIEEDNFSNIASGTYAKGYVRNYARFLNLDEESLLASLSQHMPEQPAPQMQSFSKKRTEKAHDSRFTAITWLFAVVVIGMLVFWWVQKSDQPKGIDFSEPSIEEQAAVKEQPLADALVQHSSNTQNQIELAQNTTTLSATDPEPSASDTAPATQEIENVDIAAGIEAEIASAQQTEVSETETAAQAPVITETTAAPAPVVSAPAEPEIVANSLSISFKGDCWLKVQDATGKTLLEGVKSSGTETVTGTMPFKVTLGAPQMVSMNLNGQAVDMSAYPAGKVARITLP